MKKTTEEKMLDFRKEEATRLLNSLEKGIEFKNLKIKFESLNEKDYSNEFPHEIFEEVASNNITEYIKAVKTYNDLKRCINNNIAIKISFGEIRSLNIGGKSFLKRLRIGAENWFNIGYNGLDIPLKNANNFIETEVNFFYLFNIIKCLKIYDDIFEKRKDFSETIFIGSNDVYTEIFFGKTIYLLSIKELPRLKNLLEKNRIEFYSFFNYSESHNATSYFKEGVEFNGKKIGFNTILDR